MLSISHMLTGAFIASKVPLPAVYVPLSLSAHYLCDWIPHWDVGTGLSNNTRKKSTAILLELVEMAIAIIMIYFIFQKGHAEIQWHIWIAAFVGILPDFLEAPKNFLNWEPNLTKKLNDFHGQFHSSTANMILGLAPQVVLIVAIIILTF